MAKKRCKETRTAGPPPTKKAKAAAEEGAAQVVAATRDSEDQTAAITTGKWINKQRVLVFSCRGIGYRDRHLLEDLRTLMPHSKAESKMQRRRESLFEVNEIAEMKNCNKCILFESRLKRDLYMWISSIPRGPSVKFHVENLHTMAELKMTGNCLRGSRPLLSFDRGFEVRGSGNAPSAHLSLLKELLTQIFSVPNKHPKSQPFFDRVYTFSLADDKIWFRHFQIVEEDGALVEIGPRFVMTPIKIFDSSFSGATLWENPKYVSPASRRSALKRLKSGKYLNNIQSKAAYEASRPTEPTYKVDPTDDVFATMEKTSQELEREDKYAERIKRKKLNKKHRSF